MSNESYKDFIKKIRELKTKKDEILNKINILVDAAQIMFPDKTLEMEEFKDSVSPNTSMQPIKRTSKRTRYKKTVTIKESILNIIYEKSGLGVVGIHSELIQKEFTFKSDDHDKQIKSVANALSALKKVEKPEIKSKRYKKKYIYYPINKEEQN